MASKILKTIAIVLTIIVCVLGCDVIQTEDDTSTKLQTDGSVIQEQVPRVLTIATTPRNNNGTTRVRVYDSYLGEIFSGEGKVKILNNGYNGELIEVKMYIVREVCTECEGGESNVD